MQAVNNTKKGPC